MNTTKYIVELKPNKWETEKKFPQWLEDNLGILSVEPYYDPDTHRGKIRKMILDSEEDVGMDGMIEYARFYLGFEAEEFAEFTVELFKMQDAGTIMYDEKHDSWLWIEPTNKKQRDLIKNAVIVGGKQ